MSACCAHPSEPARGTEGRSAALRVPVQDGIYLGAYDTPHKIEKYDRQNDIDRSQNKYVISAQKLLPPSITTILFMPVAIL
jgi:hypothetical protein